LWLRHAAGRDLEARWPYVYNFLVTAQLPGLPWALDCLRAARLPAALREVLAAASASCPAPPALEAAAADEEVPLPPALREAEARLRALLADGTEVSAEALSWVFGEALDLRRDLEGLLGT